MRVLVVVGSDLNSNSSANLCHKAYIHGLMENGCNVDLLMAGDNRKGSQLGYDCGRFTSYCYPQGSVYEKIGQIAKRKPVRENSKKQETKEPESETQKAELLHKIKRFVHSIYGPYEVYIAWERKALAFKKKETYDLVISLSFPPVSHYLVYKLLKKGHITAKRWIQIWEDPWCQDLVFRSLNDKKTIKRAQREEEHLLKAADEILYVSPITLESQRKMFSAYSDKMKWLPVPTYYSSALQNVCFEKNRYGYFGDYSTQIRNLEPFYKAAEREKISVTICGNSDKMFASKENIIVRPRISLEELKPIEDNTNVLVFLSNLRGGQIPGKIYQYSATEKTILFILDGTKEEKRILKKYFGSFNRYIFCENTVKDISRAIGEIEKNCVGKEMNSPLECFNPTRIVKKILDGTEGKI